jgi:hypothetical protein
MWKVVDGDDFDFDCSGDGGGGVGGNVDVGCDGGW